MIRRRLREPWVLAVGAVVLVAIAFYAWTAATSAPLFPGGDQQDPYNRLVDGFLHGHAYLSVDPPQGLLDLPHPLDPKANQQYVDAQGLRDLSLHDGHLYAYWGAAPAVVAFLPWRVLSVLGVGDLSTAFAALLFSTIGLLCAIAVMRMMVRRWLPDTPVWLQAVAAAMLAFGSYAPWLLRRPEVYEVAISAGFCFVWAGLLCVGASVSRERPRLWLLALGSLFFGLAFASRPPVGVAVAFAVAAGVLMWRRFGVDRVRVALAALAPFGACLVLVAIYNAVRFGSPTDFGVNYLLSGQGVFKYNSVTYIPANLWYYLIAPLRPRVEFPFLWVNVPGSVPFSVPKAYDAPEKTAGLLPVIPLLAVLFAGPWVLRGTDRALRRILGGLVAAGVVVLLFTAFYYWGGIQRYEMDFAGFLLVPALIVWFVLSRRRAFAIAGTVLVVWGVISIAAMSMVGSDDRLRQRHPGTFASLADFFSPVGTAMANVAGHPILGAVKGDPLAGPKRYDRLGVDGADAYVGLAPVPLNVTSPGNETAAVAMRLRRTQTTPSGAKLVLQVRAPDGSVFARPFREGPVAFPVALKRGRNTVQLQLFADPSTGIAEFPDAEDDGAIQALDVRVREGRPH